jgi:hypothetical protein
VFDEDRIPNFFSTLGSISRPRNNRSTRRTRAKMSFAFMPVLLPDGTWELASVTCASASRRDTAALRSRHGKDRRKASQGIFVCVMLPACPVLQRDMPPAGPHGGRWQQNGIQLVSGTAGRRPMKGESVLPRAITAEMQGALGSSDVVFVADVTRPLGGGLRLMGASLRSSLARSALSAAITRGSSSVLGMRKAEANTSSRLRVHQAPLTCRLSFPSPPASLSRDQH